MTWKNRFETPDHTQNSEYTIEKAKGKAGDAIEHFLREKRSTFRNLAMRLKPEPTEEIEGTRVLGDGATIYAENGSGLEDLWYIDQTNGDVNVKVDTEDIDDLYLDDDSVAVFWRNENEYGLGVIGEDNYEGHLPDKLDEYACATVMDGKVYAFLNEDLAIGYHNDAEKSEG